MCLSTTILETLATTAEWECANGCKYTARKMDMIHIERVLMLQRGWDPAEIFCGLSRGEWQQVMRYEVDKRKAEWKALELKQKLKQQLKEAEDALIEASSQHSQAIAYLAEAEAELTKAVNNHDEAREYLAKAKVIQSYAALKMRDLQEQLEGC